MKKIILIAAATGRDYMIAKDLSRQPEVELSVIIWSESCHIKRLCNGEYHVVDLNNINEVCKIIEMINPAYVIPGQGDILQHGLTNILAEKGIVCLGPIKEIAKIEGSKTFMRRVLNNIDDTLNPRYKDFFSFDDSVVKFLNSFEGI